MDDDDQDQPDQSLRDRRQAQSAAGDLSRMGIDPRSLGLGDPEPRTPPAPVEPDEVDESRGRVVPIRPEFSSPDPLPAQTPEPDDPVRPPSAAEQLLSRASNPEPAPRQTGRMLRTVARGLTTPDAALAVQGEREAVDAIRHRQTDRRIVAFVAGKGGVGCTTIAVGVGTAFMAMREDHAVVVDVQQGSPSLGRTFGAAEPRTVGSMLSEVEATTPPAAATGLGLVDGSGWDQGLTRGDVAGVLDRLRADHTFNLLDVGDDAGEAGHAALARADQAVVVTSPGSSASVRCARRSTASRSSTRRPPPRRCMSWCARTSRHTGRPSASSPVPLGSPSSWCRRIPTCSPVMRTIRRMWPQRHERRCCGWPAWWLADGHGMTERSEGTI